MHGQQNIKIYVLMFSATFVCNFSHSEETSARYCSNTQAFT